MNAVQCDVLFRPESAELRFLPEGPIQCRPGVFSWVAIQHGPDRQDGSLNVFDLATRTNRSFPLPGRPGFAFPTTSSDHFLVGMERRVGVVELSTGRWTELCGEVDADVEGTIINDAVLVPQGIVFGCKDLAFREPKAGLYFWRRSDRRLFRLRGDQICSNGKVALGEGPRTRLLDIDSPRRTVVQYELDVRRGTLSRPQLVLDLRNEPAFPDGMIATPDGQSVIIAFYNPEEAPHGEARQYRLADGQVQQVWRTDRSPQVTCPLLLEHEGGVSLVLTTAVEHMPPEKQARLSNAGCLFIGRAEFDRVPAQPLFPWP